MSELVGNRVQHKQFGEGLIVAQDEHYVQVKFARDIIPFQYPYAFEQYLSLQDPQMQASVLQALRQQIARDEEADKARQARQAQRQENREKNILQSIRSTRRKSPIDKRTPRRTGPSYGVAFRLDEADELPLTDAAALAEQLAHWQRPAGSFAGGNSKGKAIRMKQLKPGHLLVFTERADEEESEDARRIRALAIVQKSDQRDDQDEPFVVVEAEQILCLPDLEEPLLFWQYYHNASNPQHIQWGTGRFRYLSGEQTGQLLNDVELLSHHLEGDDSEKFVEDAQNFVERFFTMNPHNKHEVGDPQGALVLQEEADD